MSLAILLGFDYKNTLKSPLPYTKIDIERIKDYIEDYGFQTLKITDYDSIGLLYTNLDDLATKLRTELKGKSRVFFFYTGHAEKDQTLIMPNLEKLTTIDLLNILRETNEKAKILSVFDSCYGTCLPLAFERRSGLMKLNHEGIFTTQNIISLSATPELLEAEMVKDGSVFTKYFTSLNLKKLIYWSILDVGRLLSSTPGLEFSL